MHGVPQFAKSEVQPVLAVVAAEPPEDVGRQNRSRANRTTTRSMSGNMLSTKVPVDAQPSPCPTRYGAHSIAGSAMP